ncbi:unnamed protein product [Cylicocyclus nassatus]|uniref:Uncharacterized protein n=1 Tax=Cylicocyclus nassatus TaxID=53992 RepID=A0AA36DPH0_CYLNA|nr:unnamed protein product [Cylicocyclus nassatus]
MQNGLKPLCTKKVLKGARALIEYSRDEQIVLGFYFEGTSRLSGKPQRASPATQLRVESNTRLRSSSMTFYVWSSNRFHSGCA